MYNWEFRGWSRGLFFSCQLRFSGLSARWIVSGDGACVDACRQGNGSAVTAAIVARAADALWLLWLLEVSAGDSWSWSCMQTSRISSLTPRARPIHSALRPPSSTPPSHSRLPLSPTTSNNAPALSPPSHSDVYLYIIILIYTYCDTVYICALSPLSFNFRCSRADIAPFEPRAMLGDFNSIKIMY